MEIILALIVLWLMVQLAKGVLWLVLPETMRARQERKLRKRGYVRETPAK